MRILRNIHRRHRKPMQVPHWILVACAIGLLIVALGGCAEGCFFANVSYSCPSILDIMPA